MSDTKFEQETEEKDAAVAPQTAGMTQIDDQDEIQVVTVIKGCAYDPLTRL